MAITGTESRFQNMKVLAEELEVNGTSITGAGEGLLPITTTALTDNSTGSSGGDTIAAVTDTATAADAIATLAAKINEIIAALD